MTVAAFGTPPRWQPDKVSHQQGDTVQFVEETKYRMNNSIPAHVSKTKDGPVSAPAPKIGPSWKTGTEGIKSSVANAWLQPAGYPCGNFFDTSSFNRLRAFGLRPEARLCPLY